MRVAPALHLKKAERAKLLRYSKPRNVPKRLRERSLMILLAGEGLTNKEIARHIKEGS